MALLQKNYANVEAYTDRHGRRRYYFRKSGHKRVPIDGAFGSAEFDESYERAKAHVLGLTIDPGSGQTRAGTVHDLCVRYYASYDFRTLRPETQKLYRYHIEAFRAVCGKYHVRAVTPKVIEAIKADMADRPGACRNMLKRLTTLFLFAVKLKMCFTSPLAEVRKPAEGDGFTPWTDHDIALYEARWPSGTRERLALYMLLYLGQRRTDTVRMGRQHVSGDEISVAVGKTARSNKSARRLWIPLHPKLAAEMAFVPEGQLQFLIDPATGKGMSSGGFGNWIRKKAREAGIAETRSPHGLRKAACRRMIENGTPSATARAVTGHASDRELEPYVRDVNQRALARQAVKAMK